MPKLRQGWSAVRRGARRLGLTKNLGLKAGAVLLAFAVWLYVAAQEKTTIEVGNVPLKLESVPTEWAVTGDVPDTVNVRLRGSKSTLTRVSPAQVSAFLDLSRAQLGQQIMLLDAATVRAPFGVDVEAVTPPQVILTLEAKVTGKVPIQANLTGEVPEGHEILGNTVDPPEARVRGAESVVGGTESVTTRPVPLNGRRNAFTTQVGVLSPRPDLEILGPGEATVRVEVAEIGTERTLEIPVETLGEARGRVQFNPRSLPVTLKGPVSQVEGLQPADLRVAVTVQDLEPQNADYHLTPEVVLRRPQAFPNVEIKELGQRRIDVHIYAVQD
jgi:YbbR domain-containing protein